jgi:hypothetical protein
MEAPAEEATYAADVVAAEVVFPDEPDTPMRESALPALGLALS